VDSINQLALLKLSDLQWMTRLCRSIVKLQELTPRSKQYLRCTQMIKILERLEAPYQSMVTVVKPGLNGGNQVMRKMVEEASLADQIETQGYHLRPFVTTIDFSKKKTNIGDDADDSSVAPRHEVSNNEQSEEHKLIAQEEWSLGLSCSGLSSKAGANPANSQYILFLQESAAGLPQE